MKSPRHTKASEPTVLLLKSKDTKYVDSFRRYGYNAVFSDVLAFSNENVGGLHKVLHSLDQYVGLIITSPRAASAIVSVIQSVPADEAQTLVALLKEVPIYVVGKVTSKPLSDHLGVACLGEDSGSAEVLATFIADSGNLNGPMVFLCGEKRMDALPLSFHARSQRLDELVVYASHQVDGIEWLQTASAPPQWVAFFSPSGVDAALRMTSVPWSSIKKVALGKSSAAALAKAAQVHDDKTWEAKAVAAKPTPDELIAAIVAYDKDTTEVTGWMDRS
ncbi:hypothetical protein H310_04150 [Aphanomyces invadans]|uniref:Uroporphyrinogen-III synthase n=1 Tax=Aphanomyces invadans TaxID=157072 RepID=A0A024UHN9_9STRA|nr:hypothetical protein H310_04150 [Aphanomyces invadans]ETW05138.1 hypothetical protein H310_04150 [Aphanomyces invadans]|eukprot:XP_008866576.1 hypothetical protein H310_04150 [Aphanomyces invadans]